MFIYLKGQKHLRVKEKEKKKDNPRNRPQRPTGYEII
jgi:hypothetical protein